MLERPDCSRSRPHPANNGILSELPLQGLRSTQSCCTLCNEFGFDPQLNVAIVLLVLRLWFRSWFRVQVSGIENLPKTGAALVVANHAGVLPLDG